MKDNNRNLQTLYEILVKWQIKDYVKRRKAIDRDGINSWAVQTV